MQDDFNRGFRGLRGNFSRLAVALGRLPIARATIVEYPGDPFAPRTARGRNGDTVTLFGGCGAMDGISGDEAKWLARQGQRLNRRIADVAGQYRWSVASGATDAFRPHGYCHTDEWFVEVSESIDEQEDLNGTLHPNRAGHRAASELLVATMRTPGFPPRSPLDPTNEPVPPSGGTTQD